MNNPHTLPVLVYGTLRANQRNEKVIAPYTLSHEVVTINNAEMYDLGSCPTILLDKQGSKVTAELHYIDPHFYDHALHRLDQLEGFIHSSTTNVYDRVIVKVKNSHGEEFSAYVYVAGDCLKELDGSVHSPIIASGDWLKREILSNE